jgi:DNA modification methylase
MYQVVQKKITELKPHPKNPNSHTKDQIERLSKVMKYQGFRSPIRVSNLSGYIIAGHGRLLAAKKLGLKEVPVIYQDYESDDQEYADLVADNALAEWSELDLGSINTDIADLGPDFDIDMLGLKDFEIEFADKLDPQSEEDEVPEYVEPKTKLGDIYQLGNHRLMCGDSTSIDAVEKLMNGQKADMVFTDPPYGVSYQSNMRTKSEKFAVIENDETFLSEWVNVLPVVSHGWVFVWTTWKVLGKWLEITSPLGNMSNMIIWDKGGGGIGDLNKTFSTDYEIALVFNREASITGKRLGSVWSIGKDRAAEYKHPTQKPVELAETAILNCTNNRDKILDLFGGSGSTLIACEKTNRRCFMMELDPKYCDVIVARWEKYTGKEAVRIENEEIAQTEPELTPIETLQVKEPERVTVQTPTQVQAPIKLTLLQRLYAFFIKLIKGNK